MLRIAVQDFQRLGESLPPGITRVKSTVLGVSGIPRVSPGYVRRLPGRKGNPSKCTIYDSFSVLEFPKSIEIRPSKLNYCQKLFCNCIV
jgi:hypothetical protein